MDIELPLTAKLLGYLCLLTIISNSSLIISLCNYRFTRLTPYVLLERERDCFFFKRKVFELFYTIYSLFISNKMTTVILLIFKNKKDYYYSNIFINPHKDLFTTPKWYPRISFSISKQHIKLTKVKFTKALKKTTIIKK